MNCDILHVFHALKQFKQDKNIIPSQNLEELLAKTI